MCNCNKNTYIRTKAIALKHQKLEKKDVYIYFYEGKFGYCFDLSFIPDMASLYETISY